MNFSNALKALRLGHQVAREAWDGAWLNIIAADGGAEQIVVRTENTGRPWVPNQPDILADDWELVDEDEPVAA